MGKLLRYARHPFWSDRAMALSFFTTVFGLVALLGGSAFAPLPVAQENSDPYRDWIYLYEDTFQNEQGSDITQQWWLNPDIQRRANILEFSLLARRSPVSSSGAAAGVFLYITDCDSTSYALREITFLDSKDAAIETQSYQRAMVAADPDALIYPVLRDLCDGVYD